MDTISSIFQDEQEEETLVHRRACNPRAETYLSPANIKKTKATGDIPQALEREKVRGVDDNLCQVDVFRRSSLLLHSPPRRDEGSKTGPAISGVGTLPDVGELKPVVVPEKLPLSGSGRASTPLEMTRNSEGEESVAIFEDLTLTQGDMEQGEGGEASGVSSIVFAPSMGKKRGRGLLSESAASTSVTGDEGSVAASEEKPKKKRNPERPRKTNIIDKIVARRKEREKERQQEQEGGGPKFSHPSLC